MSDVLYRLAPGTAGGKVGGAGAGEREKPRLVGRIVLDAFGERHQPVGIGGVPGRDGRIGGVPFLGHDLGAAGGIPCTHQLDIGQVLRTARCGIVPAPRDGKARAGFRRARPPERHDGVVDRVENLMGEPKRPVPERLFEEVVGRRDRADQRVLDRQASRIGLAGPDRGHHVLRLPAGQGRVLRPPAPGRGLAEGAMGSLNRHAHTSTPW